MQILNFLHIILIFFFFNVNAFSQKNSEELLNKAWNYFEKDKKYDSAITILKQGRITYPKDIEIIALLGQYYLRLQQYQNALDIYNKGLSIEPGNVGFLLYKAQSCYYLKMFLETEKCISKAKQLEPNNEAIYSNSSVLHFWMGKYEIVTQEILKFKQFGNGDKEILVFGLMAEALLRQLNKVNLPPSDWIPKYDPLPDLTVMTYPSTPWLEQLCNGSIDSPEDVLGKNNNESTSGKRFKFKGTKENPFKFARGFFIWDAEVIYDNHYGILLSNGSKIKFITVINNVEVTKYGTVNNWSFVWD